MIPKKPPTLGDARAALNRLLTRDGSKTPEERRAHARVIRDYLSESRKLLQFAFDHFDQLDSAALVFFDAAPPLLDERMSSPTAEGGQP